MSERIIYLNGDYLPESEAKLPVLDRGLLFADAVYEGFGILDGQIVDFIYHMQRLERSLGGLECLNSDDTPTDAATPWAVQVYSDLKALTTHMQEQTSCYKSAMGSSRSFGMPT